MAITVDTSTYVIFIPKADLTLIQASPEVRELNMNTFRYWLKGWEDDVEGIVHPKTHNHNTEASLAGLTYARIIEVLAPYTIEFEDGQYTINCVGANHNLSDVKVANQVSLIINNAAGLISNAQIEYSSFNSGVTIDTVNGEAGTLFPQGTPQAPVNNLTDAKTIANFRGFDTILVIGNLNVEAGANIDGYTFQCHSHVSQTVNFDASASCNNVTVKNARVTGTVGTNFHLELGILDSVSGLNGHIHRSSIKGTITLGNSLPSYFFDCSNVDQDNPATIDMNVSGQSLSMPNYSGLVTILNMNSATDEVGIGINHGMVIVDSSVTQANQIVISGVGILMDMSSVTINSDGLMNKANIANSVSDDLSQLKYRIESLRTRTPGYGKDIFMDIGAGNDANTGFTESTAVETFSAAHALVTDGGHDVIFVWDSTGTYTPIDDRWSITKSDLSVRGPGWDLLLEPSDDSATPVITIAAEEIVLEKFHVSGVNTITNSANCIEATNSDHTTLTNMKIKRATNIGVRIINSDDFRIERCLIEHFRGNNQGGSVVGNGWAICVMGDSHEVDIRDNFIYDTNSCIHFMDTTHDNNIRENTIHDSDVGIHIVATVSHTYIHETNMLANLLMDINDETDGSTTYFKEDQTALKITDFIMEDDNTLRTTANSFGKKIQDIPDETTWAI